MKALRFALPSMLGAVVCLVGLWGGVQKTQNAVYPSWPHVFDDVVGGPSILLFIAVATVLAGLPMATALHARWPAHVRTRMDVRRWIVRMTVIPVLQTALLVAVSMAVWGVFVFGWLTSATPHLVDSSGGGTSPDPAYSLAAMHPFYAWTGGTPWLFVTLSAGWAAVHGGLIALTATVCSMMVHSRVLALVLPAACVVAGGVVAELAGLPVMSPLLTWVYPGGLAPSDPLLSLVPSALTALSVSILWLILLVRAPTQVRFA